MGVSPAVLRAQIARTKNIEKRIDLQFQLGSALFYCDVEEANKEMTRMYDEYASSGNARGLSASLIIMGRISLIDGVLTEGLEKLHQAKEYAELSSDPKLHSESLWAIALANRSLGNYREALSNAIQAAFIQEQHGYHRERCRSLYTISQTYVYQSDYKSALQYALEGLNCSRSIGDLGSEAMHLAGLGNINLSLQNTDAAIEYFEAALKLDQTVNNISGIAVDIGSLCTAYINAAKWETALSYAKRAEELAIKDINSNLLTHCYFDTARAHFGTGDLTLTEEFLNKAIEVSQKVGYQYILRACFKLLGDVRAAQGELIQAKQLYEKALASFDGNDDIAHQIEVLTSLSKLCEAEKDLANALLYQKRLADAKVFETRQKNHREIVLMQVQVDTALLEQERESYKVKAMQAMEAFERKTRELSEVSVHLARRRDLLTALLTDLTGLEKNFSSRELHNIRKKINTELSTGQQIERVDEILSKLEPGFLTQLKAKHPELSKTELKVCLLLKLNLQTPEIANLLLTSERTIENHRLHIRKKIKILAKQSLQEYLNSL